MEPGAGGHEQGGATNGQEVRQFRQSIAGLLPFGREIYVATIGGDGVLRGIEPTLTRKNIAGIKEGMRAVEVRDRLGPPYRSVYMKLIDRDVWEYPWRIVEDKRILWVQFSRDGVVQEVIEMHDFEADPPSGPHGTKP